MKFRHLDVIRHKNGCAVFDVVSADTEQDMYTLRCPASYVVHTLASNLVDSMFIGVFPLDESGPMKFEEQVAAFQVKYVPGPSLAQKLSAVWDTSKVFTAQPLNPTLPIAPDVAVSLPGLPSGYYLKAFRKALPGDLVLNTSGAVVPAIIRKNWGTLYRPVVGHVSNINATTQLIPGVPEGWTVIAYRRPKTGEQCLRLGSTEVFTCGENDWAEKRCYVIVQKIPRITPCDGTLPGIPKEYKLVGFGAVKEDQFFIDKVVTPAKTTQNGMTLYRPIVGRVSCLNVPNHAHIPGVPAGWVVVAYRSPFEGEHYLGTYSLDILEASEGRPIPSGNWPIVKRIPRITPCDGTLPGIPKEYKLVGFGAVKEDQFFIDTVGTLKPGPAKHRLILEQIPVKQQEVVTEYELEVGGVSFWTSSPAPKYTGGRTGRTRKVVVQ